jgi:hypothetical protein
MAEGTAEGARDSTPAQASRHADKKGSTRQLTSWNMPELPFETAKQGAADANQCALSLEGELQSMHSHAERQGVGAHRDSPAHLHELEGTAAAFKAGGEFIEEEELRACVRMWYNPRK